MRRPDRSKLVIDAQVRYSPGLLLFIMLTSFTFIGKAAERFQTELHILDTWDLALVARCLLKIVGDLLHDLAGNLQHQMHASSL